MGSLLNRIKTRLTRHAKRHPALAWFLGIPTVRYNEDDAEILVENNRRGLKWYVDDYGIHETSTGGHTKTISWEDLRSVRTKRIRGNTGKIVLRVNWANGKAFGRAVRSKWKKRHRKRWAADLRVRIAIIILICFICFGALASFYTGNWDIAPPDTSDLSVRRISVPDEENANTYFSAATNLLHWPQHDEIIYDILDGKTNDSGFLAGFISSNQQALAMIGRGLGRKFWETPEASVGSRTTDSCAWRRISRLMALEIAYHRDRGRTAEATQACCDLIRFDNLLIKNPSGIFHYLSGIVNLAEGLKQARSLASPSFPIRS